MKKINRRNFLKVLAATGCSTYALRPFSPIRAFSAPGGANKVFILVNFAGGVSYNIAPPLNSTYLDRNPTIGLTPEESLNIHQLQGLHSSLTNLHTIYDEGDLAVINMVGYPEPNRSHETSTNIKFSGIRGDDALSSGGWASRLTCQMISPYAGISLSGSSLLTEGICNPPRALGSLSSLGLVSWGSSPDQKWRAITESNLREDSSPRSNSNQTFVKNEMDKLEVTLETIREQTEFDLSTQFPNTSFGRACEDAAKLVMADSLGTQFIFLTTGGYDTHSDERGRLSGLLSDVDQGLGALITAIKAGGRWNDVVISTVSEFSRTHENGSLGSDHGHAGPTFVMGGAVNGGVKSEPPSATESSIGNYFATHNVDYRIPFIEIVRDFLGKDPTSVFPERIGFGNGALNLF